MWSPPVTIAERGQVEPDLDTAKLFWLCEYHKKGLRFSPALLPSMNLFCHYTGNTSFTGRTTRPTKSLVWIIVRPSPTLFYESQYSGLSAVISIERQGMHSKSILLTRHCQLASLSWPHCVKILK